MKPGMLDWEKFKKLTGSDSDNFQKLCRSIVRRRFGQCGPLIERRNQPGVEFYIRLNRDCSELGSSGEQVGWQCKWFQIREDKRLTSSQKRQIKDSLGTTNTHLGDINRWILWCPFTLADKDQNWFYNLQSAYRYELHLWNAEDIDSLLEGSALELRHAYFGELALTDEALEIQHNLSVAPIKERWIKEVHHQVRVEKKLQQYLGQPSAWKEFKDAGTSLLEAYETIKKDANESIYRDWSRDLKEFLLFCSKCLGFAEYFTNTLSAEDIESINGMLGQVRSLNSRIRTVLRQIRSRNLPLAIEITNSLAYIRDIRNLLENASEYLSCSLVAVLADAGGGKTQMAAELTATRRQGQRPAGILLHGRRLHKGGSLDDLTGEISFYGQKVPSFQALVSALDAAAYRRNCRLPVIIDGLSEAEEPREWKPVLNTALELLKDYPNVLLICTLRTGEREYHEPTFHRRGRADNREVFAQMSLPEDCIRLKCDGFGDLTIEAIKAYFQHYKIEAGFIWNPGNFFSHPLNLRIFCEVTNRKAEETVRVTSFPTSITTLFGKQIEYAAERIAEFTNLQQPYSKDDVLSAVFHFGKELWESGERQVSEADLLRSLDQPGRSWDENILNLLAQEGIIFRNPSNIPKAYSITPVFDRLGGYIIADALLKENGRSITYNQTIWDRLFGENKSSHSLSQDIMHALIALAPKYLDKRRQLWMVAPEVYGEAIVELSTLIDAEDFCDKTKEEFREQILRKGLDYSTLARLENLLASDHPLNADFLSELLRAFSVKDRDLSWTEYIRGHYGDYMLPVLPKIDSLVQRWRSDNIPKTEGDRLLAVWVSWLLSSTSIEIRDFSTRALYWYGRSCPKNLFEVTISSLDINDPYVAERLLAASYGVVMYFVYKKEYLEEMKWLVSRLYRQMFCKMAKNATTHFLARDYASQIIRITRELLAGTLSDEQLADASHPYISMPRRIWGSADGIARWPGIESPLGLDFEKYTIGRLVPGRTAYDFDHPDYQDIRAKILWRVKDLGWNKEDYAIAEERVVEVSNRRRMHGDRIERYGKKYSWIAYYEIVGQRLDEGMLDTHGERFAADIDPGFPNSIVEKELGAAEYLGDTDIDTSDWIKNSNPPEIDHLTKMDSLDGISGPWILLDGGVSERSSRMGRYFDFGCRAILVDQGGVQKLISYWRNGGQKNIEQPEIVQSTYLYSGELNRLPDSMRDSDVNFNLVVGKKVERKELPTIALTEKEGTLVLTNKRELKDVEIPVYESIGACNLVAEFRWVARNSSKPRIPAIVPSLKLMETLNLKIDPASLDVVDIQGNLAARNIYYGDPVDDNHRRLFYLRADLLTRFMTESKLQLVWLVQGRRTADIYTSDAEYKEFSFANQIRGSRTVP